MRLRNGVIIMALAALRPAVLIERVLVFAAVEQTGVGRMAKTAAPADLRDAGRVCSVIAVAGVACGRAEIPANEQCASMNTVAIFGELRRREWGAVRKCEPGHDFRIGMAGAACLRDPLRVHFGLRIFRRANTMNAMATHTRWSAIVMFVDQYPAMRTVLEFRQLIGRQRRIEVVHLRWIGMAPRTEFENPRPIFLAIFLRPFLHEIVTEIGCGIAAMTTRARDPAAKMNVLDYFLQFHVRRRLP